VGGGDAGDITPLTHPSLLTSFRQAGHNPSPGQVGGSAQKEVAPTSKDGKRKRKRQKTQQDATAPSSVKSSETNDEEIEAFKRAAGVDDGSAAEVPSNQGADVVPEKKAFVDRRMPGKYVPGRHFVAPKVVNPKTSVPAMKDRYATPFVVAMFAAGLAAHENQDFAKFVVDGVGEGFRLNTDVPEVVSSMEPLKTALEHEEAVDTYLAKEVEAKRMFVYDEPPHPYTVETAIGVVPKKSYVASKQKFRIISHFSKDLEDGHPSVNASIDADDYSMELVRIEEVIETMRIYGTGSTLTVCDCEAGYRQVPVHHSNYHHQVYRWKGRWYMDTRLTFGSRASPLSYASTSGAMEYIIQATMDEQLGLNEDGTRKATVFSFIDDFLVVAGDAMVGAAAAKLLFSEMKRLGVPLSLEKSVGKVNVTELEYLGMYLNSATQTVSLPEDKRANLMTVLGAMTQQQHGHQAAYRMTKKELQSLVGKLTYAHLVIPMGRPWVNPMLAAVCRQPRQNGPITISAELRVAAIHWLSLLKRVKPRPAASMPLAMAAELRCGRMADGIGDASGNQGFGFWLDDKEEVYFDAWEPCERSDHTLGEQFVDEAGRQSSTLQEGKCMLAAALTWLAKGGRGGKTFVYQSDSRNLVHLQRKGRSRTKAVNEMYKRLTIALASADAFVHVVWKSREEEESKMADLLSRCDISSYNQAFRSRGRNLTAVRCRIHASIRKMMVASPVG
jgi:hypothetical protein